jgi:hypothetical protein
VKVSLEPLLFSKEQNIRQMINDGGGVVDKMGDYNPPKMIGENLSDVKPKQGKFIDDDNP